MWKSTLGQCFSHMSGPGHAWRSNESHEEASFHKDTQAKLVRPARHAQFMMSRKNSYYRIQTILITRNPKTYNSKSVQKQDKVGSISWTPAIFLSSFPCDSVDKESACNAEDLGSIPGLGSSPGEGKGYPLQYSGLENSVDCVQWQRVGHDWTTFTFIFLDNKSRFDFVQVKSLWLFSLSHGWIFPPYIDVL